MKFLPLLLTAMAMPCLAAAAPRNPLPMDPAVRTATLPNGLTYYIRHNAETPKRADFFIAQRVGSVHERDNEQGLAHFLEHMAFNGTEHFPGKSLITYLESIGVRFGANLNAYTSTDETVYNISNVPVQRPSTVDSCLLVLRDWSCGITLDTDEINDERGVITGEYRQRMSNPSSRMQQQFLPQLDGNGRRGHRMPLGTLEVINGFEPQVIRNFYTRWYNPQNQAIIAVGDFNVDSVETRIKTMFGNIPVHPQAMRTADPDPAVPSGRAITVSDPDQGSK